MLTRGYVNAEKRTERLSTAIRKIRAMYIVYVARFSFFGSPKAKNLGGLGAEPPKNI